MVPARVGRAESTKDTEESPIALTSGRQEEVTGRALDRTVGSDDSEYDAATDASEDGDFKPSTAYKSWEDVPMEFRCTFVEGCVLDSPDRKVISHFFGRNKKCTRAIPESVWAPFCRRHYQRTRYRNVDNFGGVQMDLVRRTVENLQVWGGVANFELILRKRAMQAIRQEEFGDDKQETLHAAGVQPSPDLATKRNTETWLVPYLGKNKAFEDILEFVDLIEEHVKEHNCKPPEFEILPSYQPGYMRLPEAKKSLKQTAKPAGVKKRASHPNVKLSRAGALLKEVGEPKTTPQITPSVPSRNPETHSGRGTLVRGRPLRATGTIPPQGLFHRPTRSSSS
ncbi:hypothetical protein MMC13_000111 [Lambiella insularis]|nr:hypothetical protein [Lambiella insularis]